MNRSRAGDEANREATIPRPPSTRRESLYHAQQRQQISESANQSPGLPSPVFGPDYEISQPNNYPRVTKEDFRELKQAVAGLAEAQARMDTLAVRMEDLAEAQKRTEHALQRLAEEHTETRRQPGGLAMTVGYTLENEAYRALPELLRRDFGIIVQGRLKRAYVTDREGQPIEVNLISEGLRDGRKVAYDNRARCGGIRQSERHRDLLFV